MMKIILLGLLLPSCILAYPGLQISGGQNATRNQFPYQISLQVQLADGFRHSCGGSILSETWILTAAHCVEGRTAEELQVVAGILLLSDADIPGRQIVKIGQIISHTSYSFFQLQYDIALLELSTPLQYGDGVQPINIPTAGEQISGSAVLSGWGLLSEGASATLPDNLQYAVLPIVSAQDCRTTFGSFGSLVDLTLNVCSGVVNGNEAACNSDSGGPLAADDKVIGIVSWGSSPCGNGNPTVYVRTASYVDWISSNTNGAIPPK